MRRNFKVEKLEQGEPIISREPGHSTRMEIKRRRIP